MSRYLVISSHTAEDCKIAVQHFKEHHALNPSKRCFHSSCLMSKSVSAFAFASNPKRTYIWMTYRTFLSLGSGTFLCILDLLTMHGRKIVNQVVYHQFQSNFFFTHPTNIATTNNKQISRQKFIWYTVYLHVKFGTFFGPPGIRICIWWWRRIHPSWLLSLNCVLFVIFTYIFLIVHPGDQCFKIFLHVMQYQGLKSDLLGVVTTGGSAYQAQI